MPPQMSQQAAAHPAEARSVRRPSSPSRKRERDPLQSTWLTALRGVKSCKLGANYNNITSGNRY